MCHSFAINRERVRSNKRHLSYIYNRNIDMRVYQLFITLLLPILCLSQSQEEEELCYEDCVGFGLWLYGRGWIIPPYQSEEIGKCLERPPAVNGQGDIGEQTLVSIFNKVVADVELIPTNGTVVTPNHIIARGLTAAKSGSTVPNSEGMYYCVVNDDTNREAFYWIINCDVLMGGGSGNANLCGGLTDDEQSIGQQGYFVDGLEKQFIRYVFNDTHAIETDMQPIPYIGEEGFSCSGRDWYQQGLKCTDPAKVLCPLYFQGTTGLGTFQAYGDKKESVVVAQDIATWQLCQCMEDLSCDADTSTSSASILRGTHIIFGWFLLISIMVISWIR